MIKHIRRDDYVLSDEDREEHSWAEWAFQSHNWVEENIGYFKCKLCGIRHTSCNGISFSTINLCLKNPIVMRQFSVT